MPPAVFLDHSYRKIFPLHLGPERIVVPYRCCSAEQVSYAAPPQTQAFGHGPVLCNNIGKLLVDVRPPVNVISIGRIRQPAKDRELQMIVCVDESGHNEEATKVHRCAA